MSDVPSSTFYLSLGAVAGALFSLGVISAMSAQDDTSKNYDKGKYYARWVASIGILGGAGIIAWLAYRYFGKRK